MRKMVQYIAQKYEILTEVKGLDILKQIELAGNDEKKKRQTTSHRLSCGQRWNVEVLGW